MTATRALLPLSLFLLATRADAVIEVGSGVSTSADGVRAQAVITNASGFGQGSITAVAIKEVHAAIFVIDNNFGGDGSPEGNPLAVHKHMLTAQQAYGLGLPFGYTQPPTTDPTGPWFGLTWPYRDQYDYFPDQFDPLADDVGSPFMIQPNIYGFLDIDGIARGGPTDPEPAGGSPDRLLRGITGNGLTGPASYFLFDLIPLFGNPDRFVTVRILSATARVVVTNPQGQFSEIQVQIPDFTTQVQLPEPTLGILLPAAAMILRRSRRQS